jgi:hypothetical protein
MVRRVALAVAVLTGLASGSYVFIYLYRWEWNRALIATAIFIAAEIALVGAAVLDRVNRLDRRMDELEGNVAGKQVLARIQETAPKGSRRFAWLTESDGASVFVPVLMGAGVVISAFAWALEKIAQKTARPLLERDLAARLTPIALTEPGAPTATTVTPTRQSVGSVAAWLLLLLVAVVGSLALADATQNRPDAIRSDTASTLALEVFTKGAAIDPDDAAKRLWYACSGTISSRYSAESIASRGHTVEIDVRPGLGPYGERRLRGCLEDATLDNLQAKVVDFEHRVISPNEPSVGGARPGGG